MSKHIKFRIQFIVFLLTILILLPQCVYLSDLLSEVRNVSINEELLNTQEQARFYLDSTKLNSPNTLQINREDVPQIQIRKNLITEQVNHIFSYTQSLTKPTQELPATIVTRFLKQNATLYGLSESDVSENVLYLTRNFQTKHNSVTHLTFQQKFENLPVFGSGIRANILSNGSILSVSGQIYPKSSLSTALKSSVVISSQAAISIASTSIYSISNAQPITTSKIQQMLFPLTFDQIRRVWSITLNQGLDKWLVIVDAERGTVFGKYNLTSYFASGKVFALTPQPNLPRVKVFPPMFVDREIRSMDGNPIASPRGWIDTSQNTTIGNNVIAQEDQDANDKDGFRPTVMDLNFDFPLILGNPSKMPKIFQSASITNLFYWTNFMHDYLYNLGFDEAAGNFQTDNFGRGGIGGDPIIADALDGSSINNSSFSVSEDGFSPRMSMFLWNKANPPIDGDYDAEIIVHEYAHGLTNRLVGGPLNAAALLYPQSAGMAEGWSDWFALSILTKPGDNFADAYPFGSYVSQNFKRGLRRFPYSTNMSICPVVFADIDPEQTRYPDKATEVHRVGEIWCTALWEVRANFIAQYGFQEGKQKVEQLVVDALKLTPENPSMIDGRDALLLADQVNHNSVNRTLIWKAFAKRGLGFSAQAFNSGILNVKQSFDVPPYIDELGQLSLNDVAFGDEETIEISLGKAELADSKMIQVNLFSDSGDTETVTLIEDKQIPALFKGTISVSLSPNVVSEDRVLQAKLGDHITALYVTDIDTPPLKAVAYAAKRIALFTDDIESGIGLWKSKISWTITNSTSHSSSHSWTNSLNKPYPNNANSILVAPSFDLSKTIGAKLTFWHKFDIEKGFDFGLVEIKVAPNKPWQIVTAFSGEQKTFFPVTIDLSNFDKDQILKVRFRLISDSVGQKDGWYIDDFAVTGAVIK